MTRMRYVSGAGDAGREAIFALGLRVASAICNSGLRVLANRASRNPGSPSRYITFTDGADRIWLVRVSNHRMPVHNSQPVPHFDLVSLDGQSGLDQVTAWLARVAARHIAWSDPADRARRAELRRRDRARRWLR